MCFVTTWSPDLLLVLTFLICLLVGWYQTTNHSIRARGSVYLHHATAHRTDKTKTPDNFRKRYSEIWTWESIPCYGCWGYIFSSPELKAKVSYSYCLLSVVILSVC